MKTLAIDVGSSTCKIGLFSEKGLEHIARRSLNLISEKSGHAELDPEEVWAIVKNGVKEVLAKSACREVRALSFSSIGEALAPVGKTGVTLGNSILSFDTRGGNYIDALREQTGEDELFSINANAMGPHLSLAKILWRRDNMPDLYRATAFFLPLADFLGFKFGASPYTTDSLACRTMLFDVARADWSEELLDRTGLDREKFAPVVHGGTVVGTMSPAVAGELGIRPGALLVAGGHDQCCNALGCGCTRPGDAVVGMGTYETYCPVFAWPESPAAFGREGMNIEQHVLDGLYVSFLHHYSGRLINWYLSSFAKDCFSNPHERLEDEMPSGPSRVLFLPYIDPPQWPRYAGDASGAFFGLKSDTTRGEMFKAVLEGIAFFFVEAVAAMGRVGIRPAELLASGGGSRSDRWMQMRADIIGIPFTRVAVTEGSLNGAALLAGLAAGMFPQVADGVRHYVTRERTFEPDPASRTAYLERYDAYRRLEYFQKHCDI